MYALNKEHEHTSITERWEAIDDYFVCITECDLNDQVCITRCLSTHFKVDNGFDTSESA